jgi:hypothetical protein
MTDATTTPTLPAIPTTAPATSTTPTPVQQAAPAAGSQAPAPPPASGAAPAGKAPDKALFDARFRWVILQELLPLQRFDVLGTGNIEQTYEIVRDRTLAHVSTLEADPLEAPADRVRFAAESYARALLDIFESEDPSTPPPKGA